MATPTITRLSRASGAYFQANTGAAYDRRVLSGASNGVHVYEVTLADGESATYEELFTAIGNHADWTVSITTSGTDVDGVEEPSRIINISSYNVSNHSGIILLKSGRYFHEIAGSTYVNFSADQMLMPLIGCVSSIDETGNNASEVGITYGIDTTSDGGVSGSTWNATHEILLGNVRWRAGRRCFQFAQTASNSGNNGAQRAVDWGDPKKIATPSALALMTAAIGPASGQTMRVTNNRLIYECASGTGSNHATQRQDFDVTGSGLVEVDMTYRRIGTLSFIHTTNTNPNTNVLLNTFEDLTVNSNSQTWKYTGAPEVFSTLPEPATHPYLSVTNMRGSSPYESNHKNLTSISGKYNAAFVGDSRFAPSGTDGPTTGICLQGLKSSGITYFKQAFTGRVGDAIWLDPPFLFDGTNVATTRKEDGRFGIHYLRSVAVNNRDANSSPKNSTAFTVGIQNSANHQAYQTSEASSAAFWNARVPPIRTSANGGTWTVREVDTAGTGLEGVVGRGAHFLFDAALSSTANTDSAAITNSDFTYATPASAGATGANDSYLIHRGGIHRYSTDIDVRTYGWDLNSNGAAGALFNNNVDDIPGLTDNHVNMFKDGLIGTFTGTGSLISGASGNITMDGFTDLTANEVAAMVGASLVGVSGHAEITAASRTNATTVVLTVTARSSGISYTDNVSGTVYWDSNSGYSWTLNTTNNREILISIPANRDIVWSYTSLAALIQAKIEKVVSIKQDNLGSESAVFGSGNDSTYGGSNINANTLLETLLAHATTATDKSFMNRNTTTGTTLDLHRVLYTVNTSSTLTLNPDEFITSLNYGSTFTVPARVTHNGSYTDSGGTPNFIDVVFPSGFTQAQRNAVTFSVGFQAGSNWRVGANPTLTTQGTRYFLQIPESAANGATGNTDNVWYLSATGAHIQDFRVSYTGSQTTSITLLSEPLRPTGTSNSAGTMSIAPYVVTNPGNASETFAEDTVDSDYPKSYINDTNRLGLKLTGYNGNNSSDNLKLDFLSAKDSTNYADFVMRYGVNAGASSSAIAANSVDLFNSAWRIGIVSTSFANFLTMDNSDANFTSYTVKTINANSATNATFSTTTYSTDAAERAVRVANDEQTIAINAATKRTVNNAT